MMQRGGTDGSVGRTLSRLAKYEVNMKRSSVVTVSGVCITNHCTLPVSEGWQGGVVSEPV
jgi:hypothetical protein